MTTHAGHAKDLAKEAALEKFDAVVIIGGDGSVNEAASALIGSDTALGIIAAGSGNGVAHSLGLPVDPTLAIQRINVAQSIRIDTGELAGRKFVGVAGLGYGAKVSQGFLKRKMRGMLGYVPVMLRSYSTYRPFHYSLDGGEMKKRAFIMEFANTSEYGNRAKIAPMAEFNDGLLEWICITKMPPMEIPFMLHRLFKGSLAESSLVQHSQMKSITLRHTADIAHVDGEPFEVPNEIEIRIVRNSLSVLV